MKVIWEKVDFDDLPEERVLGACFDKERDDYNMKAFGYVYFDKDIGVYVIDGMTYVRVTHYMEIPEYEGEEIVNEVLKFGDSEVYFDMNFKALAEKHGVRKGNISFSDTFNDWVLTGHPDIDMIVIEPPYKEGEIIEGIKDKSGEMRFVGWKVSKVDIVNNDWVIYFEELKKEPRVIKQQGQIDVKRLKLPNNYKIPCKSCGVEIEVELDGDDYYSSPKLGAIGQRHLYCGECDTEQEVDVKLDISVTVFDDSIKLI